jgi:nucleotide-binding universal stress UspA family protein
MGSNYLRTAALMEVTMERILVGIDGSEQALEAARLATRLARRLGDSVTLAYVVPPAIPRIALQALVETDRMMRDHFAYAGELLRKLAAELATPEVTITTQVLGGNPAAALAELARDHDIELVVVGSHGLNPVERALLGSVTSRLTRTCSKPVVVVPPVAHARWRRAEPAPPAQP